VSGFNGCIVNANRVIKAEPGNRRSRQQLWVERLAGRTIKIIGLGGIGSWVSHPLVQFLASLHAEIPLWLVDGDTYQEANRSRALFDGYGNKAAVKAAELAGLALGGPAIVPVPRYVTPRNVEGIVGERDIILLCVDNHKSRRCVSNAARKLRDVLLISGGNDGVEERSAGSFGNVIIYRRENRRDVTNPLTKFHPEIAHPADKGPYERGCAELTSSSPQLLYTNLQVATTMLCAMLAWLDSRLDFEEVYVDILASKMTPVVRSRA